MSDQNFIDAWADWIAPEVLYEDDRARLAEMLTEHRAEVLDDVRRGAPLEPKPVEGD